MELYKKTPLTWNNENYEIQVLYNDNLINVLSFHNNHPANGFRHQIRVRKDCNIQEILKQEIVEDLIEISKNEIFENRWGKLPGRIKEQVKKT
jgi:hypothetical protein